MVVALVAAPRASAAGHDFAGQALNIIPSGQYGDLPVPAGADTQAKMYDGLTPLFGAVTPSDLTTYFKSERFGLAGLSLIRTETPRSCTPGRRACKPCTTSTSTSRASTPGMRTTAAACPVRRSGATTSTR